MEFVEGLPKSKGYSMIFVVIERFTKYEHFMTLSHSYTAHEVAKVFLGLVFKLHGFPKTIVSDRNPLFFSSFYKDLFALQGITLDYSSAYHPQSDGQMEAVTKVVEGYLRCFASSKPSN